MCKHSLKSTFHFLRSLFRHHDFQNNRQAYLRDIFETLDDNKKIVIVCQGATEGKFIKKLLNEKYPDRVTKFYYGKTSDKDKDK